VTERAGAPVSGPVGDHPTRGEGGGIVRAVDLTTLLGGLGLVASLVAVVRRWRARG
jgi:hypothetical protein